MSIFYSCVCGRMCSLFSGYFSHQIQPVSLRMLRVPIKKFPRFFSHSVCSYFCVKVSHNNCELCCSVIHCWLNTFVEIIYGLMLEGSCWCIGLWSLITTTPTLSSILKNFSTFPAISLWIKHPTLCFLFARSPIVQISPLVSSLSVLLLFWPRLGQ